MTTEQKNRIVSLRQAGTGYTAVAREVGITKSAVCKYCHQIGRKRKTWSVSTIHSRLW